MDTITAPTPFRTRTPDGLNNLGKPRRDYTLVYAVPGSTDENADNGLVFEVGHHSGDYTISVTVAGVYSRGESFLLGARDRSRRNVAATGRYSRKKLDALFADAMAAGGAAALIPEDGPLRTVWDRIVAATENAGE